MTNEELNALPVCKLCGKPPTIHFANCVKCGSLGCDLLGFTPDRWRLLMSDPPQPVTAQAKLMARMWLDWTSNEVSTAEWCKRYGPDYLTLMRNACNEILATPDATEEIAKLKQQVKELEGDYLRGRKDEAAARSDPPSLEAQSRMWLAEWCKRYGLEYPLTQVILQSANAKTQPTPEAANSQPKEKKYDVTKMIPEPCLPGCQCLTCRGVLPKEEAASTNDDAVKWAKRWISSHHNSDIALGETVPMKKADYSELYEFIKGISEIPLTDATNPGPVTGGFCVRCGKAYPCKCERKTTHAGITVEHQLDKKTGDVRLVRRDG